MADLIEIIVNFQGRLYLGGKRVIANEVGLLSDIKISQDADWDEVKRTIKELAPENADAYSFKRHKEHIDVTYYRKVRRIII
jgi:hypothetical protein